MKNNAIISLRTLQEIEGEDKPNTIELKTKGRFAEKNGKYYVIYEESEMTGFEDTTTTIKVSSDMVSMTRNGKFNSKMVFKPGEKRLCSYSTPYGVIPVGVNPTSLKTNLTEKGGDVLIDYILDVDNQDYIKNSLKLTVTRTDNL